VPPGAPAQGLLVVQPLALDPLANLPGVLHAADRRASFPSWWENRLAAVEKRAIAINDLGSPSFGVVRRF
jgi:hypothetical protein